MKNIISFFIILLFTLISFSQSKNDLLFESSSQATKYPLSITVGGEFITTGTVPAFSGERVDQFVTRIFNQYKLALFNTAQDERTLNEIERKSSNYALRNIKLIRSSGDTLYLDLQKFRLTADFSLNPYLMNEDVLIFPSVDLRRKFIEISGAINYLDQSNYNNPQPLKIQYVPGDKLKDALLFAGGISVAYDSVKYAEISRLSYDGKNEEKFKVSIKKDLDFELKPGDRIRVLADETLRRDFKVYVDGEVFQPGYIYITKNQTTLREVILKAGGFKENADLNRAELIRGGNVYNFPFFNKEFDLMMMQRMSNISLEDSATFIIDNNLRFSRTSTVLNFEEVMSPETESAKFKVKNGDYISIPEQVDLVYVFGQVLNPGYIEYIENRPYSEYIAIAGGLGKTARGDVYLIKGKTRAWIDLEENPNTIVEPGDYIWAAKEQYRDFDYYLTRIGSVASIIGAVATVVLLFVQALK